jgi:LacI family transcriptional regulator
MKPRIKMSDIARELNVSTVTVSKALNDKEGVSDKLREQIKQQAGKMNYVYNSLPRSMLKGRNFNIGILIGVKYLGESSFYWIFFQKLLAILKEKKYLGILEIVTAEDEECRLVPAFMQANKVDGVIVLGQLPDGYLQMVTESATCVFLDFYSEIGKCDCIASNNFLASYKLTKLLIDRGHRKIAFIGTTSATTSILDRYMGFCKAMLESGLPHSGAIEDRDSRGYTFPEYALDPGKYTAYVCNNDYLAGSVIRQLGRIGLRVPKDISIVGFDNAWNSVTGGINVTSVEFNVGRMCEAAVESILLCIEDENYRPHGTLFFDANIIAKDSVINPKK